MDVKLHLQGEILSRHIAITGSKSETNRLLLLNALHPGISINNASVSDDSTVMQNALLGTSDVVDVHHAGTAMRFLTAYFAIQPGRMVTLTGSPRMKERPIGILVDALRALGAEINYLENVGYPPLRIKGKKLPGGSVVVDAHVSSQYITALLLIGGKLEQGLELRLDGTVTSLPYINMTLRLLAEVGISSVMNGNVIKVYPQPEITKSEIIVESDWSSASYYYSIIALSNPGTQVTLSSYREHSLQGDSALVEIYRELGVNTQFADNTISLTKTHHVPPLTLQMNMNATPDIAQTLAVTCFGLGIGCTLTGLHTLKIKETDRLGALRNELQKLGATVTVTNNSLILKSHLGFKSLSKAGSPLLEGPAGTVETYNDHRMAMAFAPLAVKVPITIKDAGVVSKSYPDFWTDMKHIGLTVQEL